LKRLESVEDADSPVRIIVSVGMLKEGWDVKNVYVIASLRALVAEILTEQTLGRGLRLPFGEYADIELLDTLEVLAHERDEQLLKKTGVINEGFVDYRTRVRVQTDANGDQSARPETVEIGRSTEEQKPLLSQGSGSTKGTGAAGLEPATPGFGDRCSAN
jgi:type III restriction enzyme